MPQNKFDNLMAICPGCQYAGPHWDNCPYQTPIQYQDQPTKVAEVIRKFSSGATRDSDEGKFDYHRFGSALVEKRFCTYMHKNRVQSDKSLRAPDNWKNGIPKESYLSSLGRHMKDLELHAEGFPTEAREDEEEALCAIIFNARGLLYELLKAKQPERPKNANPIVTAPNNPQSGLPNYPITPSDAKAAGLRYDPCTNTYRDKDNKVVQ